MRPALLPGLLRAAARNQARGFADVALFEVGHAFHGAEPGDQHLLASGIRIGRTGPRDPHGARRPVDLFDARADAEAVLSALGAPAGAMIRRGARDWWHPGRHGIVGLGPKTVLAVFGELHPKVLRDLDVKGPAVGFTLFLDALPEVRRKGTTRPPLALHDLQAVERDFAFVVDAGVDAEALIRAAKGADKALISEVSIFDVFDGARAGSQMGEGRKSLAIAVRLQPTRATLTESEIEAVSQKIVAAVAKATGGALRS